MRELLKRRRDPKNLDDLRRKVQQAREIVDMRRDSTGWKLIEFQLGVQIEAAVKTLSDRAKSAEEVDDARHLLVAVELLRSILSRIESDGQNAQEELNLLTKEDDQHG